MNETKKDDMNIDIMSLFDNFIKPGVIEDEKEVVKGFKIKVKVLDVGELAAAEAIIVREDEVPVDVIAKVRAAKILSQATLAINDVPIERGDMNETEKRERRILLYKQFLRLPAIAIQKSYEFYLDCVTKQENFYNDVEDIQNKTKNF